MNLNKYILSGIFILIMVLPVAVVSNDYSKENPTLWILRTDSGNTAIEMGISEIRLNLHEAIPDIRVIDHQKLKTLDASGDYLVVVGHGYEDGIDIDENTLSWEAIYDSIRRARPVKAYVLACYSPLVEDIIGFRGKVDARAGGILTSWMIAHSLGLERICAFDLQEAAVAQSRMYYPLERYLYFVHGYFGSNADFANMYDSLIDDGVLTSFSGIRYFDYLDAYGLELPDDVFLVDALHQITTISDYASNFADELCSLPSGTHVSVVAHSMGGLITREMLALYRTDIVAAGIWIDDIITIGAPNGGTWFANPIHPVALLMQILGGVVNFAQFWPSTVFYSMNPVSQLIQDLNADPYSYSYGIEWHTCAGYDPVLSALAFTIHFDLSDPLVAVNKAHLYHLGVEHSVTYSGIDHSALLSNTGSQGTHADVYNWLCLDPDFDGDGLTDLAELNVWGTSIFESDTDDDGLSDYEEIVTYGTDPNNPNSDGDAINDGTEIAWGYDPLDNSDPIQASALIQSFSVTSNKYVSVTATNFGVIDYVRFYVQYKRYDGTWTSYQLITTDYTPVYTASWTISSGYAALRIKVQAYNSGNVYLGLDTAFQQISGGGGGGDPVPY